MAQLIRILKEVRHFALAVRAPGAHEGEDFNLFEGPLLPFRGWYIHVVIFVSVIEPQTRRLLEANSVDLAYHDSFFFVVDGSLIDPREVLGGNGVLIRLAIPDNIDDPVAVAVQRQLYAVDPSRNRR